jgi:cytochrome c
MFALLACPGTPALAQDVAAGEQSFRKCVACHKVGEGAKNGIGPTLNGLPGRTSGTIENYNYSEPNKSAALTWDETTFLEYIKDPKAKIPGTKMIFPGIKDEREAKSLWAYLAQFDREGRKK